MEQGIPSKMYNKHLFELYRNPSNFGILKNATHSGIEYNSICGDEISVQLSVKNERVADVKFSGSGCVLSLVSASLLTSKIKGMKTKDIKNLNKEEVRKLFKTKMSDSRIKCVLLPLEAVKKALK